MKVIILVLLLATTDLAYAGSKGRDFERAMTGRCDSVSDRDLRYFCKGKCGFIVDRDLRRLCREDEDMAYGYSRETVGKKAELHEDED